LPREKSIGAILRELSLSPSTVHKHVEEIEAERVKGSEES
jgi:DNA-binding Lrp family transcriptional regulator